MSIYAFFRKTPNRETFKNFCVNEENFPHLFVVGEFIIYIFHRDEEHRTRKQKT